MSMLPKLTEYIPLEPAQPSHVACWVVRWPSIPHGVETGTKDSHILASIMSSVKRRLLQFAKLDTLLRHIGRFQDLPPGYHCEDCKKGFKRKDHLVQHLRHFHRLQDAQIATQFPTREAFKMSYLSVISGATIPEVTVSLPSPLSFRQSMHPLPRNLTTRSIWERYTGGRRILAKFPYVIRSTRTDISMRRPYRNTCRKSIQTRNLMSFSHGK